MRSIPRTCPSMRLRRLPSCALVALYPCCGVSVVVPDMLGMIPGRGYPQGATRGEREGAQLLVTVKGMCCPAAHHNIYPRLAGGCHAARDTEAPRRAAGFTIETVRRFPFKRGPIAAPHILGAARRPD